jgi:hypothetical protein
VTVWAAIAVVWLAVAAAALTRWVPATPTSRPAPLRGPERIPTWNLVALRIFEGLSAMVLVALADGPSPVERGFERWRPALQPGVRTLAAIGFGAPATILVYQLPFSYMWSG